uniref:SSD domain-containing protein n=1 Tax=Meloidogyne floridensis TaxID=298350 RepID=A0A915PEB4_9BILA
MIPSTTKVHSSTNEQQHQQPSFMTTMSITTTVFGLLFFDNLLVGKSDPSDFSKAWRKKFSKHPSWCDADMCLQQINSDNAYGNRLALYSRALFQKALFHLGEFVQKWPKSIIVLGIIVLLICCYWLKDVKIETDLVKLWVEQGGRLDEEMAFLPKSKEKYYLQKQLKEEKQINGTEEHRKNKKREAVRVSEIPTDSANFGGGFQVVIQTPEHPNMNMLTREALIKHVNILEQIANYSVEVFGETWYLSDICFKPPPPTASKDVLSQLIEEIMAQIIPCVWITPIDCFWEGSKPLGPFPPLDLGPAAQFVPSVSNGLLSWKTLNPEKLLNSVRSLIDVTMVSDLFERAGIGAAYQDRPCIDPLDPDCPNSAPNYFDRCQAYAKFKEWNNALPEQNKIKLEQISKKEEISKPLRKREVTATNNSLNLFSNTSNNSTTDDLADYYDNNDDDKSETTESPEKKLQRQMLEECNKYGISFMKWINENRTRLMEFLSESDKLILPQYPNYGEQLTGGCKGFGKNIMHWPEDLIVGGIERDSNGFIRHAEGFQTVFLVASAGDVQHRISHAKSPNYKTKIDKNHFTTTHASVIIQTWQRSFTKRLYEHELNRPSEGIRVVHPLASTSISEMLEQFSEFQFGTIFIGYILMIIYAGWSQLQWDGFWFSSRSSCLLAVVGVLMITFASVAGLGVATAMGINFNAATTQIVPFLTLGLGIDDMFLLLHNYNDVLEAVKEKEVAVLLKETGMSILITSINNILAFITGCILPIPALRSFCGQTAILLTSNVLCIIMLYPAFIALDLKRRKAGYRDMLCGVDYCYRFVSSAASAKQIVEQHPSGKRKLEESSSRNQLVKTDSDSPSLNNQSEIDLQQMSESVFGTGPALKTKLQLNCEQTENNFNVKKFVNKWLTLNGFLHEVYIPTLRKPIAKATILFCCSSMFLFGCIGLYQSKIGLELADVLPEDTAPAAFLKAREKYFSFYPMFIVPMGPGVDYSRQQRKLEQLRADIAQSEFVIKADGKPEAYWMIFMRSWLHALQAHLDKARRVGIQPTDTLTQIAASSLAINYTLVDDFYLARRLLCSRGEEYNCSNKLQTRLIDSEDIIDSAGFYNYLTAWYYVSQAGFFPTPPGWRFVPSEEGVVPQAEPLIYSQIPFYMNGLTETPAIVQMIKEIRAICDRYTADGFPVYPTGIPFTFWEQYLQLTFYLFVSILTIATAVLLVISVIIFNPWAAAMVAIIVVSMTVELAGFMGLFGVKMNPISAVTLITAVGIGVEFTAHVVLAFLTSLGTRDERMVSCLDHMFVPVIHGGLSTLLGIVMLAFSEFDFVVKYFFVVMSALVIIGLINGLALLPVLLSLIGPPCEITPFDGDGTQLACPLSKRHSSSNSSNSGRSSVVNPFMIALPPDSDIKKQKVDVLNGHKTSQNPNNNAASCSSSSSTSSSEASPNSSSSSPTSRSSENKRQNEEKEQQQQTTIHNYHESLSTLYEASTNTSGAEENINEKMKTQNNT